MPSFDVVSKLDLQELENALNNARKEIQNRYDFQGTHTELTLAEDKSGIVLKSANEGRLDAAYEVLLVKLTKRNISLRGFSREKPEPAAQSHLRQLVKIQQGIPQDKAKELIKLLKESKLKVQGSIQADQLRVNGKNKDDLQEAIALLRQQQDPMKLDLQFTNFRD